MTGHGCVEMTLGCAACDDVAWLYGQRLLDREGVCAVYGWTLGAT